MSEPVTILLAILAIALVFYLVIKQFQKESERWSTTLKWLVKSIPAAFKDVVLEPLTGRPLAFVDFISILVFAVLCYKSLALLSDPLPARETGPFMNAIQPYVTPAMPIIFLVATVIVTLVSLHLLKEK